MKSSTSMWIWIIGGILVGTIVFTIAYSQLMATSTKISEQRVLEQYGQLGNKINNLCWSFVDNERDYRIVINRDTELVYLSDDEDFIPKNTTDLIQTSSNSTGQKLCVLLKNSRPRCMNLECEARMPYIGSIPPEESLLAMVNRMMGSKVKYEYNLQLKKGKDGKVNVKVGKI
ncbi:MAG: hypothetical protein ABEK17_00735 [Candidatus Aenigmatarchaeota archaeon]